MFHQALIYYINALDWAVETQGIDEERVGIFGISLGAIKASLIAHYDKRIRARVFYLPGGDLGGVIYDSKERKTTKMRERFLKDRKLNREEFLSLYSKQVPLDPFLHIHNDAAESTQLYLAKNDSYIPFDTQLKVRTKLGNPESYILHCDHEASVYYLPYAIPKFSRFFQEKLKNTN